VDAFLANRPMQRIQLRFHGWDAAGDTELTDVTRLDLALRQATRHAPPAHAPQSRRLGPLHVPALSQRSAGPELGPRLCSPTSLAMVLAYRGRSADLLEVARRAHDPWHDIYGNWPRAIQCAWSFGVPGYLTAFGSWEPVQAHIADGQPVIVSISFGPGELAGAAIEETTGHLLVLVGFDGQGGVIVNDPAAAPGSSPRRVYDQAELGRAWFGHGGVAYVLAPARNSG